MQVRQVEFVKGAARWEDLSNQTLPEIAFLGRSNVGKSSLVNMLVGRKALAHTSGTPGKTQQLNYYLVDERYYFVDLPGLGYAKVPRVQRDAWIRLITRYLAEHPPLRAVLHLVDSRHPPTAYDRDVMTWMKGRPLPYLIALTKADKLSGNTRQKSVAAVRRAGLDLGLEVPIVLTSAKKREGARDLWKWITAFVGPAG
jgi:GTP-binding protein